MSITWASGVAGEKPGMDALASATPGLDSPPTHRNGSALAGIVEGTLGETDGD